MDITLLGVPGVWIALGFGSVLMLLSFFIKSIILNLAIILCMVGVMAAPETDIMWVKAAALLMTIWAVISMFRIVRA